MLLLSGIWRLPTTFSLPSPRRSLCCTTGRRAYIAACVPGTEKACMTMSGTCSEARTLRERWGRWREQNWWSWSSRRTHYALHNHVDVIGRRLLNVCDLRSAKHDLFIQFILLKFPDGIAQVLHNCPMHFYELVRKLSMCLNYMNANLFPRSVSLVS